MATSNSDCRKSDGKGKRVICSDCGRSFHYTAIYKHRKTCPILKMKTLTYEEQLQAKGKKNIDLNENDHSNSAVNTCPMANCVRSYSSLRALQKHCRERHSVSVSVTQSSSAPNFLCALCDASFYGLSELCAHVRADRSHWDEDEHASRKANPYSISRLSFTSVEAFDRWKEQVEWDSKAVFFRRNSNAAKCWRTDTYHCARSGGKKVKGPEAEEEEAKLPAARAPSRAPPLKMGGRYCTAFIKAKVHDSGVVETEYCLDHYGHRRDFSYVNWSSGWRADRTAYLLNAVHKWMVRDYLNGDWREAARFLGARGFAGRPCWLVKSESDESKAFVVEKVLPNNGCTLCLPTDTRCGYANCRVCPHEYECSCKKEKRCSKRLSHLPCKHVHLVASKFDTNRSGHEEFVGPNRLDLSSAVREECADDTYCGTSDEVEELKVRLESSLRECGQLVAGACLTASNDDVFCLRQLLSHVSRCKDGVKLLTQNQQNKASTTSDQPANPNQHSLQQQEFCENVVLCNFCRLTRPQNGEHQWSWLKCARCQFAYHSSCVLPTLMEQEESACSFVCQHCVCVDV